MIDKIKENIHILVALNVILNFFILMNTKTEEVVNLVNVNGHTNSSKKIVLKKAICEMAFNSLRDLRPSDYYFHPDLIEAIKESSGDTYNLSNVEQFYFKMEGRDICRAIGRKKEGFIAFETVISRNGPILYRITSIKPETPQYSEIKEYL